MKSITAGAVALALTLIGCGGDEPSADDRACAASDDLTAAMETDAGAVDAAIDDLIAAARAADSSAIRDAGARLAIEAAKPPAADDQFGIPWSEIMAICEDDQ